MSMDKSESIVHIERMKAAKSEPKAKKQRATHLAGVQFKQSFFIPGRGTVEAESIEEAIKKPSNEDKEVEHGDK